MPEFDFTSPQLVLQGTLYGETRGCGRAGMENAAQVVLNRVAAGWSGGTVVKVCLAPEQFSSWNAGDPNRMKIIVAATMLPDTAWDLAGVVAASALAGRNPDRVNGADSYFARSMPKMPYWAKAPATWRFQDGWHAFWRVHPGGGALPAVHTMSVPVTSVMSSADALNQAQLNAIQEA